MFYLFSSFIFFTTKAQRHKVISTIIFPPQRHEGTKSSSIVNRSLCVSVSLWFHLSFSLCLRGFISFSLCLRVSVSLWFHLFFIL